MEFTYTEIMSTATFLVALIGISVALSQLRRLNRTARSSAVSVLYDRSDKVRQYFIDRPDLRPYFYENAAIATDHPDYPLVVTIAEIYINFQEHKTFLAPELGKDWPFWKKGRDGIIAGSPIMRELMKKEPQKYTKDIRAAFSD